MTKCQTNLVRKKIFHRFLAFFRLRIIQIEKKNWKFHFFEKFDQKWPFLAQIWGPIWSKGPTNIFFDFFAPWTWKMMGHMIKLAQYWFLAIFGQKWAFWAKRAWKGYFWPKWPENIFFFFFAPWTWKMMVIWYDLPNIDFCVIWAQKRAFLA